MMRSTALDPAVLRPGARRPLPLLYRLFRAPVRRLLERVFDLAVHGLEYLPRSGPYIVAANHHNYLDGVVLGAVVPDVALLALRSGPPVIPAGITGTYEALAERWGHIPRRSALRVRFGPPRRFLPDGAHGRRTARQSVTQRIMDDIATLLT